MHTSVAGGGVCCCLVLPSVPKGVNLIVYGVHVDEPCSSLLVAFNSYKAPASQTLCLISCQHRRLLHAVTSVFSSHQNLSFLCWWQTGRVSWKEERERGGPCGSEWRSVASAPNFFSPSLSGCLVSAGCSLIPELLGALCSSVMYQETKTGKLSDCTSFTVLA